MKNIKWCFKVVKQYSLSNNPSSSLMTQIASPKKKKKKKKIKKKQNLKLKFMKANEQNLETENS